MTDGKQGVHDIYRGIAWMLLASMLWALVEWIGHRIPAGNSALQTVWVRYGTHLGFMVAVLGPRYGRTLVRTRRIVPQMARSLLMLAMPVCFIAALGQLAVNTVWAIFWVSPFMVLVASRLWLGEEVGAYLWLASGIGFAGTSLILGNRGAAVFSTAAILALGMAASYGFYLVMTRAMREETTQANLFYTALFVWLALTALLPLYWRPLTWRAARPMIAIGVVGFFALLAIDRALHLAPASIVAPIGFTEVVWSALFTGGGTGRNFTTSAILGTALVLGSVVMIAMREMLRQRAVSDMQTNRP